MSSPPQTPAGLARMHPCWGDVPVQVDVARFGGRSGVEEIHLTARPTEGGSFEVQLEWLQRGCRGALEAMGMDGASVVLRRFFCSDLSSQAGILAACPFSSPAGSGEPCAISWIGQAPPSPAQVALWAYYISDPHGEIDKRREGNTLTLRRGELHHYWTLGITSPRENSAFGQTWDIFTAYDAILRSRGLSVEDNLIRTWLFLRDIETDYGDFVKARREVFAQHGLTPQTHYVASTGIGGVCAPAAAKVALDAYAIAGVQREQIGYVKALDHLCPTDVYGVTFERATVVTYRDRKHVLISGTASIDEKGKVLNPGDVSRQLDRTLENIEALLTEAGSRGEDLCMLTAYLRDANDESLVRRGIQERFGGVPLAIVTAPVCRPAWLVEIDGLAIVPASRADLPPF